MRKIALTLLAVLLTATAGAQQLRWGVATGVNLSSVPYEDPVLGFSVGAHGELGLTCIAKGLYVDGGVHLVKKGHQSPWYSGELTTLLGAFTGVEYEEKWCSRTYHVDVPVHVGYRFRISNNFNLYVNAGPYFCYGLTGNYKRRIIENGKTERMTSDNVFHDKIEDRFDWGLGGNFGMELARHYQIGIGCEFGLSDVNGSIYKGDMKRRAVTFNVGYMF